MFIPIHDGKPVQFIKLQWVTLTLIAINCLVFALSLPFVPADGSAGTLMVGFGHIPSVANGVSRLPEMYQFVPESAYFLTGFTYAFIHSDWWHLLGNMLFLWVFGDNIEDALGHFRFLIFYLLSCFAAAWLHAFMFPISDSPLIGASGGAAAIVVAYLMLHPNMKIWVLALGRIPLRLRAVWVLGLWVAFQVVMFVASEDQQVSWAAHIGGIIAGAALVGLMKRRDVALFDRDLSRPDIPLDPPQIDPKALRTTKPVKAESKAPETPWGRDASR